MIGNDIVDLAQAKQESNWQRRGYLEKVFTDHEQQLIQTALHPDLMVWLLWSMKESAYKLSIRHANNRTFAPLKIACFLNETNLKNQTGRVVYEGQAYQTTSVITAEYIATVAFIAGTSPVYQHHIVPFNKSDYLTQHRTIREYIKQDCSSQLGVIEQNICFHKDKVGVPYVTAGDSIPIALTISHHGCYGAYGIYC
jgi:phosphopantetheinyl transferase (holo-ACP synthase)